MFLSGVSPTVGGLFVCFVFKDSALAGDDSYVGI